MQTECARRFASSALFGGGVHDGKYTYVRRVRKASDLQKLEKRA
jgi:hypothetical protein